MDKFVQFSKLRESYRATKYPLVLCHGLFGFDTISSPVPLIIKDRSYWNGIKETLQEQGATVITGSVAPAGSIAERAEMLAQSLKSKLLASDNGEDPAEPIPVNIIGHSMGGLDARYMISNIPLGRIKPVSLTTVATPHHGSYFADYVCKRILTKQAQRFIGQFGPAIGIDSIEGIQQLTRTYVMEQFNPKCPDVENVVYTSYGARFRPGLSSTLRYSWKKIYKVEGDNDGMVSVTSAQWGQYMGTIDDCDHLDVINLKGVNSWLDWVPVANRHSFNAMALYLEIMDSLAKRGF